MWDRVGNTVYGVLCDWDLAKVQTDGATSRSLHESPTPPASLSLGGDDSTQPKVSDIKPGRRIGTGPFMAMDLLREGPPPPHLYRHDLESLFYIIVYACMVLDLQRKMFHRFLHWECESLLDIGNKKKMFFFGDTKRYDQFFAQCQPAFLPLVRGDQSWVYGLWFCFSEIESLYERIQTARRRVPPLPPLLEDDEEDDGEEEDGIATRGPAEAERLATQREKIITYSKFMRVLGVSRDIPSSDVAE